MRDPSRINRIVEKLRAAWCASPDLRLGQLVASAAITGQDSERGRRDGVYNVFYTEDEWTERGLDEMIAKHQPGKGS